MSSIPQKRVSYFPFHAGKFKIDIQFDNSMLFIFCLCFGFIILLLISYWKKNQLFKKKGYLNAEKNELSLLLEDMKDKTQYSSKRHRNSKRLLSLLTESESDHVKDVYLSDKKQYLEQNQKGKSNVQQQNQSPSKLDNILQKKGEYSLSMENANKYSIQQNQQFQNKEQAHDIILQDNKSNNYKSRSGLLNFNPNQPNLSNINSVLQSPSHMKLEPYQSQIKDEENNLKDNSELKQMEIKLDSPTSAPKSHRFQSTADTTSITPSSVNSTCIQPPSQNKMFIESFTSIIVVKDQNILNSNPQIKNSKAINEKTIQPQSKSIMDHLQQNNQTNLVQISKIKSPTNNNFIDSPLSNHQNKTHRKGSKRESINSNNSSHKIKKSLNSKNLTDSKLKNEQFMLEEQYNMEQEKDQQNLDLSFSNILDFKDSTFCQRFWKNWKRLFLRHNILINTAIQDTILFPRCLKIIIIHIFVNLQFIAGTFIQISLYNLQIRNLEKKYQGRNDHVIYKISVTPNDSFDALSHEILISVFASLIILFFMILSAFLSKADKDILFINSNQQQLLKNLMHIQSGQSYKLYIGLVLSFIVTSFAYVQYNSFINSVTPLFVNRWFGINSIIIIFYFNIFDFIYLTTLAIVKALSKSSARAHIFYHFLIKKISWWSL